MAASERGRGVHAIGQRVLEKSCSNVEQKRLYGEKWPFDSSGLGSQTGTVACPEDSLWPLTLSLSHMMALPLLSARQKWDKDKEEETKLAVVFVSVSGLSLLCHRVSAFVFRCSGSYTDIISGGKIVH